ncbi:MAG: sulfurtransferase TusA family protein [Planctomycetaceae bacterium]|nr:sulfurtransferase TusA family protein [Planctomycetaceae bacterium]
MDDNANAGIRPQVSFDGGDLDCGNGLLLLIRKHIDPLHPGEILEIRSRERSVAEDLPAWCRMTGNDLVQVERLESESRYLVSKGRWEPQSHAGKTDDLLGSADRSKGRGALRQPRLDGGASHDNTPSQPAAEVPTMPRIVPIEIPSNLPLPRPCLPIPELAVMGIGSWPRPTWLMRALSENLQGRMPDKEFQATADDAVRLILEYQRRAGVDVLTDGEQRRDSYSSFVGALLDNCQLIPLTDLLPYVNDPESFAAELRALDVPASEVRHPAVFGPLGRSKPLAVAEYEFVSSQTSLPVKIALPGPYLLTRTMWLECVSDRAYSSRESLAQDVVRVLREELHDLLHRGVSLVQFDEPVLSEVVFASRTTRRSFMCGALGERLPASEELSFALQLFQQLTAGLPLERIGIHICRGNWTPDETKALAGSYEPLLDFLTQVPVGNYFLEACTARAGEWQMLTELPADRRIGLGMVNQKHTQIESDQEIRTRLLAAIQAFGPRLFLTPDCGFATFADNPISSAEVATAKLAALVRVRNEILGSKNPQESLTGRE